MNRRPKAMASAWPAARAASAVSGLKLPAAIKVPDQAGAKGSAADGTFLRVDFGLACAAGARLNQVQIGKMQSVELANDMAVEAQRIVLAAVVGDAEGREADADAVRTPDRGHRLDHLEQQACPVLDRAAILVGTPVRAGLQELFDQIAVGGVDFDAVETGLLRVGRSLAVDFDQQGHQVGINCLRRFEGHALERRRESIPRSGDRRGRDRRGATGLMR